MSKNSEQITFHDPLGFGQITHPYLKLKDPNQNIYYHYTPSVDNFEGIINSHGLRAFHRANMNDPNEFGYAYNLLMNTLKEIYHNTYASIDISRFMSLIKLNIKLILERDKGFNSDYCACLSSTRDDSNQWNKYANEGKGVAIGFNMLSLFKNQKENFAPNKPYIYGNRVLYNEEHQKELLDKIIRHGIRLLVFSPKDIPQQEYERKIYREISTQLLILLPIIKDSKLSLEEEHRLFIDFNNGKFEIPDDKIEYIQLPSGLYIPRAFVQLDLRISQTNRIPLTEILIGPNAPYDEVLSKIENILDKYGYGNTFDDRPKIYHSNHNLQSFS